MLDHVTTVIGCRSGHMIGSWFTVITKDKQLSRTALSLSWENTAWKPWQSIEDAYVHHVGIKEHLTGEARG